MTRRGFLQAGVAAGVRSPGEWMLLDLRGGAWRREWRDPDALLAPGSLLKLFTAMAIEKPARDFACSGSGCWLPAGHGHCDLPKAIAVSCNAYFAAMVQQVDLAQMNAVLARYQMPLLREGASKQAYWGRDAELMVAPQVLIRAVGRLVQDDSERGRLVRMGMLESAWTGTGKRAREALRYSALAKTGTARCAHRVKTNEDGLCVLASPADEPRMVLLARVHGRSGSMAAGVAGECLQRVMG